MKPLLLLGLMATCAFPSCASLAEAPRRRPNIVLIVADDLGWGELGCYGQAKIETPHLDRLAEQGMRFTQHYAGAPVCAPSRCVLLTGQPSGSATIRDNLEQQPEGQSPIGATERTIAELLQDSGYVTGCFGKWGLGYPESEGDPLLQGFDRFYGYNCQRHAHNFYPRYLWNDGKREELEGNDRGLSGAQYAHDRIEAEALRFLQANRDRPFFCFLPVTLPHLALQVPEESLAQYAGRWEETPYEGKSYLPHPTPRAAYAAMISHLDRSVGRILDQLEVLGLEEDTLVLFTSDNGPTHLEEQADCTFFESTGGLRGRKGSVFEGGLRVPLIARWPRYIAPDTTTDHVSAFEDYLPTLAAVAGSPEAANAKGISFLPTLLGQHARQASHPQLVWDFPGYGGQLAIRRGSWKLVQRGLRKNPQAPLELYDLERDPAEAHDLHLQHPDLTESLHRLLIEARHTPSIEAFRFGTYGDEP